MNTEYASLTNYGDYRGYLRSRFALRRTTNANYSLRQFAKDLGLSPSTLSEVLSGFHGLSRTKANQVAERLGLKETAKTYFCDLVDSLDARSLSARQMAKERLSEQNQNLSITQISEDQFRLIADWYHLAILELVTIKNFNGQESALPDILGISPQQAAIAVQRLIKLKLIERSVDKLRATNNNTKTPDDIPSEAIQLFQRQILQKAQQALVSQTVENREIASIIMSIRKQDLPAAKRMLKDFRKKFCAHMEDFGAEREEVYCYSSAFFSLQNPALQY